MGVGCGAPPLLRPQCSSTSCIGRSLSYVSNSESFNAGRKLEYSINLTTSQPLSLHRVSSSDGEPRDIFHLEYTHTYCLKQLLHASNVFVLNTFILTRIFMRPVFYFHTLAFS